MHRKAAAVLFAFLALPSLAAVTGVVMTPDGTPVAGANVSIHALETPEARRARLLSESPQPVALVSTKSDARGNWTLESPKEPVVELRITAGGFDPLQRRIERDEEVGAVVMWKSEMKAGSVRAAGKPVAGATVVLNYGGADYITKTDEQGKYEAPELKRLRSITVLHPSWAIDDESWFNAPPANALSRTLTAGTSIAGKVLGADGTTPVAKATILVDNWPLAVTGDDGTFTVAHAPSKWSTVVAQSGALMGTRAQSSEKSLTLKLARGGTITGRVTDAKTKLPVAGALVRAGTRMSRLMTSEGVAAITDAKGNYAITVAPGSYSLFLSHPAYTTAPVDVSIAAGQQASRDVAASPLARVSGVVMSEDKRPVAAATIAGEDAGDGFERMAMRMMTMAGIPPAVSGPDGRFSIRVLGDQEMRMKAARKGMPVAKSEQFRLAAGERKSGVVVTIPNGIAVTGKVTDSAGKPLSGVAVTAGESQVGRGMIRQQIVIGGPPADEDPVRTGSDGAFTMRVKEGTYDFAFRREGYSQKIVRGQSVTPTQPVTIETTLDPAVEITGRVVRGGTGVDGVIITTFSEAGAGASATTGPDGSFTLSGLSPGELRANIRKETDFISDMRVLTAPGRDVVIEVPSGTRVSGRVIDKESRKPITSFQAGMTTSRSGGGMVMSMPPQLKAFTSDDGSFTLDNVPLGSVNLVATAPGYAQARMNVTLEEGKPLTGVELELDPGTRLVGKVTGPDGSALSGATVRVSQGGAMAFLGSAKQSVTDSNGEYTLEALEVSDTSIDFSHPKYLGTRKEISVKGREMRLDVQLTSGTRVSGVVVTESGAPVPDAEVDAIAGMSTFRNTKTDANGAFSFDSLAAGRYRFTASKHGYTESRLDDVDVTSGAPVRLVLRSGATLYGSVRGLSADELQSATVEARGSDNTFANTTVDASGNFRLEGAPTGTVRVSAVVSRNFSTRKSSQAQTVNIAAGESQHVELEFRSDTVVRGRVTRNNRPLGSASVMFLPKRGSATQTSSSATTDEQGNYSLTGLEPGEYTVMVIDLQRFSPYQTTYEVRGSDTFNIDYTAGVLRGRVIDSGTGDPIVDARVLLRATTAETFRGERAATTDVNGTFSIDSVAPGSYTVSADKTGFGNHVTELTVTESAPPEMELRLSKNPGVILKVVDGRDGRPLDAMVAVFDQAGRFLGDSGFRFGGGTVDTPGDVKLALSAGSYVVTVSAIGYAAQSVSINAPGTQTVALTPGGRIVLRSSRSDRQRVRLVDARGHNYPRSPNRPPASDLAPSPSTLPLSNIAPGSYTLQVLTNNDTTVVRSIPIVVVEGQTVDVDV